MSAGWPVQDGVLDLGDLPAERGGVIRRARLAWQAHGTLNAARDNVIVYPCSYTADHEGLSWLIGPDTVLDPTAGSSLSPTCSLRAVFRCRGRQRLPARGHHGGQRP